MEKKLFSHRNFSSISVKILIGFGLVCPYSISSFIDVSVNGRSPNNLVEKSENKF